LYRLELEDRFGPVPNNDLETERFFQVMQVKLQAQRLAISEVGCSQGKFKFKLSPQTPVDPAKLMSWVQQRKNAAFAPDGSVSFPSGAGNLVQLAGSVLREWENCLV
jgi:transcription-repair coupling factor (superfamily II helicase)